MVEIEIYKDLDKFDLHIKEINLYYIIKKDIKNFFKNYKQFKNLKKLNHSLINKNFSTYFLPPVLFDDNLSQLFNKENQNINYKL